jgi:hypothetical protein
MTASELRKAGVLQWCCAVSHPQPRASSATLTAPDQDARRLAAGMIIEP